MYKTRRSKCGLWTTVDHCGLFRSFIPPSSSEQTLNKNEWKVSEICRMSRDWTSCVPRPGLFSCWSWTRRALCDIDGSSSENRSPCACTVLILSQSSPNCDDVVSHPVCSIRSACYPIHWCASLLTRNFAKSIKCMEASATIMGQKENRDDSSWLPVEIKCTLNWRCGSLWWYPGVYQVRRQ